MPKLVTIEPNPGYRVPKDDTATKANYDKIKAEGPKTVVYQTALEALRNSGGMYRIASQVPEPTRPAPIALDDMPQEQLLTMALSLGFKADQEVAVEDLVSYIRERMATVQIKPKAPPADTTRVVDVKT